MDASRVRSVGASGTVGEHVTVSGHVMGHVPTLGVGSRAWSWSRVVSQDHVPARGSGSRGVVGGGVTWDFPRSRAGLGVFRLSRTREA